MAVRSGPNGDPGRYRDGARQRVPLRRVVALPMSDARLDRSEPGPA